MAITMSEMQTPDRFRSKHLLHAQAADGKELVTLTGIALVDFEGTGSGWKRDTVHLQILLPGLVPPDHALRVEQWAPFMTINAIGNRHHAVNAGWAVDDFWGPGAVDLQGEITLSAKLAIRDRDGILYRVAYSVTLLGRFVEVEPPIVR